MGLISTGKQSEDGSEDSLSILEMSFDHPAILQESVGAFVVAQINTLPGVANNIPGAWVSRGPIAN